MKAAGYMKGGATYIKCSWIIKINSKLECMQRNAALLLLSSVRFLMMLCRKWANNWIKKRSLSIKSSVWLLGFQPHWLDLNGIFSYYQPLNPLINHIHVHDSVRFEISSSHWQEKVLSMNLGEMELIWLIGEQNYSEQRRMGSELCTIIVIYQIKTFANTYSFYLFLVLSNLFQCTKIDEGKWKKNPQCIYFNKVCRLLNSLHCGVCLDISIALTQSQFCYCVRTQFILIDINVIN